MTSTEAAVFGIVVFVSACDHTPLPHQQQRIGTCSPDNAPTRVGGPDRNDQRRPTTRGDVIGYTTRSRLETRVWATRVMRLSDHTIVGAWDEPASSEAYFHEDAPRTQPHAELTEEHFVMVERRGPIDDFKYLTRVTRVALSNNLATTLVEEVLEHYPFVVVDRTGRVAVAYGDRTDVHAIDGSVQHHAALAGEGYLLALDGDTLVHDRRPASTSPPRLLQRNLTTGGETPLGPPLPPYRQSGAFPLFVGARWVIAYDQALDRETQTWHALPFVAQSASVDWVCGALDDTNEPTIAAYHLPTGALQTFAGDECAVFEGRLIFNRGAQVDSESITEAYCFDLE